MFLGIMLIVSACALGVRTAQARQVVTTAAGRKLRVARFRD
jgi:hypothetical protein